MVAEAPKPSISQKKGPGRKDAPGIDLLTRSKARNLYLVRQLGAEEVGAQCGLTSTQVYSLAQREGWTKERRRIRERELDRSRARDAEQIDELVEAVATKSAVLSLGTLDNAIEELGAPGEFQAKNLQALSVAAKNFVGLYRQAKNLDVQQQSSGETNMLFIALTRVTAEANQQEKRVEKTSEPVDVSVSVARDAQ